MSVSVKMSVSPLDENVSLNVSSKQKKMRVESDSVTVHESRSYNDLSDKPSLDGRTIQGEMHETDPTVSAWAKEQTRPTYNADDVGALAKDDVSDIGMTEINKLWEGL